MNMSASKSTKKELVSWVESLNDDSIIALLHSMKLSSEGKSGDWWDELTESDRVNILSGIRDLEQGQTMNSKEFWKEIANG